MQVDMNENEIKLIYAYVHMTYLLKETVSVLDGIPHSQLSSISKSLLTLVIKNAGRKIRDQLKETQKALRIARIGVWIEDDGSDVIFVRTSKNGSKGRHGIKRSALRADVEAMLDQLALEIMNSAPRPYKLQGDATDPYAGINKMG